MAKFSPKRKGTRSTTNYMGAEGFKLTPKQELAQATLTTFIEHSYYQDQGKRLSRIEDLVEKVAKRAPVFVAKLAVYLRTKANMRSSTHVLIAKLARAHRGDDLVARLICATAVRPDDLTELVAYLGRPIPKQVKKGVARALTKFDRYQLAKYRGVKQKVSLVDLFRLVHPKPVDDAQAELWKQFMNGEVKQEATWEAKMSGGESAGKAFGDLLREKKLPYMACLRNLRNIFQSGDSDTIELAAALIRDPRQVAKSRQLPFRFLSARKALKEITSGKAIKFERDESPAQLINAVDEAIGLSVKNIETPKGRTMILVDNSGSMRGDRGGASVVSAHSRTSTADIANLFAAMYWMASDNTYVGLFGDQLLQPELNRDMSLFEAFDEINEVASAVGGGTEHGIFEAFKALVADKIKPDRIVIFSDDQVGTSNGWYGRGAYPGGSFNTLFKKFRAMSPDTQVYSVNLQGYGTVMASDGMVLISGWSDRIFDLLNLADTDPNALIKEVERIQL